MDEIFSAGLKEKRERHLQLLHSVAQISQDIKNLEEESELLTMNPNNNGEPPKWQALSIRVNLPADISSFLSGNGEGCWGVASARVKQMYDSDERGGIHVSLLNKSHL